MCVYELVWWKQYKSNFYSILQKNTFSSRILCIQTSSFGSLEAEHLHNTIKEILESLPHEFDLNSINEKYPVSNRNSLNLVLRQEIRQYNQLLKCIRNDTVKVLDAIEGKIVNTHLSDRECYALP